MRTRKLWARVPCMINLVFWTVRAGLGQTLGIHPQFPCTGASALPPPTPLLKQPPQWHLRRKVSVSINFYLYKTPYWRNYVLHFQDKVISVPWICTCYERNGLSVGIWRKWCIFRVQLYKVEKINILSTVHDKWRVCDLHIVVSLKGRLNSAYNRQGWWIQKIQQTKCGNM